MLSGERLESQLRALIDEGWEYWERFDREVRVNEFHSFVAADYDAVLPALRAHCGPACRFLELGSATGVITIIADLLGYDAYGIEIDAALVNVSRTLAQRYDSQACFVAGSFLPAGYKWSASRERANAIAFGRGLSAYVELGCALDDFDVVFGFPWGGEASLMLDLMKRYGRPSATLLLYDVNAGVTAYRGGKPQPWAAPPGS